MAAIACLRVATSTDHNYLPYAVAMAQSLAVSRHRHTRIELSIMYSGIPTWARRMLEHAAPGVEVRWVHMTADQYYAWRVEPDPLILTPHYFRCFLPNVYPDAIRRVIYVDADTLVLEDLGALWEWPLDGRPVAAALDLMTTIKDAIHHWADVGLDGEAPYFNSGVMVIDLARWRSERIGYQVLDRCKADRHRLLIRGRWNQHDQYGFNVVLQDEWTRLDSRWNHFPERQHHRPGIVHFLGDTKPGADRTRPEFTALFCKSIDATAWAGWRPAPKQ
jgi:lipopolysaccharide biosynthesis glycosyltransferase